jgi:hypothetical protein
LELYSVPALAERDEAALLLLNLAENELPLNQGKFCNEHMLVSLGIFFLISHLPFSASPILFALGVNSQFFNNFLIFANLVQRDFSLLISRKAYEQHAITNPLKSCRIARKLVFIKKKCL